MAAVTSGPSLDRDGLALADLRRRFPAWTIWIGSVTGSWWAAPPPGIRAGVPGVPAALVNAGSADELAARIAEKDDPADT